MEALEAATRRPAEMLGQEETWGTIEPGKRADLLILTADPLEDIRNTRTLETVILERGGHRSYHFAHRRMSGRIR